MLALRSWQAEGGGALPDDVARLLAAADPNRRAETGPASMLTALDDVLRTICAERPVLLVVDDLQWADNASLDFLAYVLAGLGRQRLGLLLAYRDEDRRGRHALEQWLGDTSRMPNVQQLFLERLDREDTERLVSTLIDRATTPELAGEVYARTRGNAYFTELLVRRLTPEGGLPAAPARRPRGRGGGSLEDAERPGPRAHETRCAGRRPGRRRRPPAGRDVECLVARSRLTVGRRGSDRRGAHPVSRRSRVVPPPAAGRPAPGRPHARRPADRPRRLRRGHRGPHPPARRDPGPGRRRRPASPRRRRHRPGVPMGGAGGHRGRAAVGVDGRRRRLGAGLLTVARRVRRGAGGEPRAARAAAPSGARCPTLRRPRPAARVPGPRSGMRRRGESEPLLASTVLIDWCTSSWDAAPHGRQTILPEVFRRSRPDRRCAGQPRTGGGAGRAGHRPRVERRRRARGRAWRCA